MLAFTNPALAVGVLVPALLAPGSPSECPSGRLSQRITDDRAVACFVDAAHDYVSFGKTASIFNSEAAEVLRFQLRFTRWLYRYNPVETLSEPAPATHSKRSPDVSVLSALPRLPDQIEYRFYGRHLLLVDRHTHQVIDILDDALGR